jgi:hypothetical protein
MVLCRNVLQEDDSMCELYADTLADVSDNNDNESLDSDSDIPTTSLCNQLWSSSVVVTSDSETSTEEKENSEPENSDVKQAMCGVKLRNHQAVRLFLEPQVWI